MWVAETPEYPNGRRGLRSDQAGAEWKITVAWLLKLENRNRPVHDRISMLIDSNGDGIADKKQVFFEGWNSSRVLFSIATA